MSRARSIPENAAPLPEGAETLPALSGPLLRWYDANARRLPWRTEPTPYRVWVSEIMLQQTRVETVLPYFARFLDALPDIPALASVPEGELLKLWEGLGYYIRARNLQKAARQVCQQYGCRLPADFAALRALPGFGDYTAGAVASIAFGLPVPAVDGNVLRVLSRLLACPEDIMKPATRRLFTRVAAAMLPPGRAGTFNQAMMDLGATVCLPGGAPHCKACPLKNSCRAAQSGSQRELPIRAPKKPRTVERRTLILLLSPQGVLLRRRPAQGLLASLWEYPGETGALSDTDVLSRASAMGAEPRQAVPFGEARHIFTHREWLMQAYLLPCDAFSPPKGCVWVDAPGLRKTYALPSAFRAFTERLFAEGLLPGG